MYFLYYNIAPLHNWTIADTAKKKPTRQSTILFLPEKRRHPSLEHTGIPYIKSLIENAPSVL